MIALDHMPAKVGARVLGWNMETYFMETITIDSVTPIAAPKIFFRIRYTKTDEEDPKWMTPENRFVDVSASQDFLMADGTIKVACQLEVDDELQHSCGNGHTAKIDKIEPIENYADRRFVGWNCDPQPWMIVRGGIILRGETSVRVK